MFAAFKSQLIENQLTLMESTIVSVGGDVGSKESFSILEIKSEPPERISLDLEPSLVELPMKTNKFTAGMELTNSEENLLEPMNETDDDPDYTYYDSSFQDNNYQANDIGVNELLQDQLGVHNYENKKIKCSHPKCNKLYASRKQMMRHFREKHQYQRITCLVPNCVKSCTRKDSLIDHVKRHKNITNEERTKYIDEIKRAKYTHNIKDELSQS